MGLAENSGQSVLAIHSGLDGEQWAENEFGGAPLGDKRLSQCVTARRKRLMPHTTIVNISDREADFFEMFDDQRNNSTGVELLVRAKHDRVTNSEYKLFETARRGKIAAEIEIEVPRQSARGGE